jgi:hypothetical protein
VREGERRGEVEGGGGRREEGWAENRFRGSGLEFRV